MAGRLWTEISQYKEIVRDNHRLSLSSFHDYRNAGGVRNNRDNLEADTNRMSCFVAVNRDTAYLPPPSVSERLLANHPARFDVDVIIQMDRSEPVLQHADRSRAAYQPGLLPDWPTHRYATGVRSRCSIARARNDLEMSSFPGPNAQPDGDRIAMLRQRFPPQIEALFVKVLALVRLLAYPKLGCIVSRPYAGTSLLITTHLGYVEWSNKFAVPKMTAAPPDRRTHHRHIVKTGSSTYRATPPSANPQRRINAGEIERKAKKLPAFKPAADPARRERRAQCRSLRATPLSASTWATHQPELPIERSKGRQLSAADSYTTGMEARFRLRPAA